MNIEEGGPGIDAEEGIPKRLGILAELSLKLTNNTGEIKFLPDSLARLKGLETPLILASTHLSDWDMTAVIYSLFRFTDIRAKIVVASTHDSFRQNPRAWVESMIVGTDNFIPIGAKDSVREEGLFRAGDFARMEEALKGGDSILIAACHNRRFVGYNQHDASLPPKPGIGAAFLSIRTGFPIVPISVNTGENRGRIYERPGIEISVGEPISPSHIGSSWETMERNQKTYLLQESRLVGNSVMASLASMLPEEKKGVWGESSL